MDANCNWMIAAFVVMDTLMERLDHRSDVRAQGPDAEIVTIAVVAAKYFGNHHERAVHVMHGCGYLSGQIGVSRFHRRLHRLADWMAVIPTTVGELFPTGEVFGIASAAARLSSGSRPALPERAWTRILRVRCRQAREILWLALAFGLSTGWCAGARSAAAGGVSRRDNRA